MHQTSIRFGAESWRQLQAICDEEGMPVAQFVREATAVRVAVFERRRQENAERAELDELRARVERLERRQQR